jgi:hypothetical protein
MRLLRHANARTRRWLLGMGSRSGALMIEPDEALVDDGGEIDGEEWFWLALGNGEPMPWQGLSLMCPDCGTGPLPLKSSEPPLLHYIAHCGKAWMRGPIEREQM